jgi:SWI/SNF-related matrix-associated actin-dependent regulator of chromatin subfamily A-like protein 1
MKDKPHSPLYRYQREGVRLITHFNGRALLADEPGLGKTIQSLVWAYKHDMFPCVVICPASLKWNWQTECTTHINTRSEILDGVHPREGGKIWKKNTPIWIINYDILGPRNTANGVAKGWMEFLQEIKPKLVILDEGHYIRSMKTKRTKYVKQLCKQVDNVICLTGTPLTNRPVELFPIINLLWPKEFPSFYNFAVAHCNLQKTPWGPKYDGAKHLDVLHANLLSCGMIRRRKKDVLSQLPSKTRIVVPLPISKKADYLDAVHNFIGWLHKHYDHSIAKRAAKAERIVQLGYLKRLAARLKMKAVYEWIDNYLEDTDEKLLVFAIHKSIIKKLEERYKDQCVIVTGKVKGKRRQQAWDAFNTDNRVRLLFGNIQAAGTGNSARDCRNVVVLELPWAPGDITQVEGRVEGIKRGKQGLPLFIHFLIAKGTIEEHLCKMLQKKQEHFDQTLDGERQEDTIDIFDTLTKILQEEARRK